MVEEQVIGALVASQSAWRRSSADSGVKLRALAVDRACTFDDHVGRVDGVEQRPVSINQGRVAVKRNGIDCVILFSVRGAKELSSGGDMQRYVALKFDRSDLKSAGWN